MTQLRSSEVRFDVISKTAQRLSFRWSGSLTAATVAILWNETLELVRNTQARELLLEVSGINTCDMSGIGLIAELKKLQEVHHGNFLIEGLRPEYQNLFHLVCGRDLNAKEVPPLVDKPGPVESLGRKVAVFGNDLFEHIVFLGKIVSQFWFAILNPKTVRWKDVFVFIQKAGVDALLLISMTGLLIGMIMGFQSAIPLRQMGSDVFVANIVAFAVLRELGPLLTAIILAGRSGSAIAAEIGTMKINEEVNALTTMGLDPVRFLVTSRVIGILFLAPLLVVSADFFGMIGGALVFKSLGHPLSIYMTQITEVVKVKDIIGGVIKAFPFGLAVVAIGCLRGLQTKTGASAVGDSTTSSVVTGMVMIIILDGIISVIYYLLGF